MDSPLCGFLILAVTFGLASCYRTPNLSGMWQGQMQYTEGKRETAAVDLLLVQHGQGISGVLQWHRPAGLVQFKISTGVVTQEGKVSLDGATGNPLFRIPMNFEGTAQGTTIQGTAKMILPDGLFSSSEYTEVGLLTVERQ